MPREVPGSFGSIPLSWSEMRTTPVCSSPRARVETVMCTAARRLERWIIIMHSVVCYYKVDLKNALIAPGCLGGAKTITNLGIKTSKRMLTLSVPHFLTVAK